MSQFTKYNNPNRKKVNRKISRSDADIIAAKNMIDDLNSGIELPLSYYDQQSDELCGMPSRNIYQASEPKTTVKNILVDFIENAINNNGSACNAIVNVDATFDTVMNMRVIFNRNHRKFYNKLLAFCIENNLTVLSTCPATLATVIRIDI